MAPHWQPLEIRNQDLPTLELQRRQTGYLEEVPLEGSLWTKGESAALAGKAVPSSGLGTDSLILAPWQRKASHAGVPAGLEPG